MSIDRNGRAHKPKGLPAREAGTYERTHATTNDDDLQTGTPTPAHNDPWATDPNTPINPDMFDTPTPPAENTPARRTRHTTIIPDTAPTWDGIDITPAMIAEYAPVNMNVDDIQPDTIRIDREHATVTIKDRSDNLKQHRITMPTPEGMQAGTRLAWDGRQWRILKQGTPQPATTPAGNQPTSKNSPATRQRTTANRPADRPPAATPDDTRTIRRQRLTNATLIVLRGLATAIRRGLNGRSMR